MKDFWDLLKYQVGYRVGNLVERAKIAIDLIRGRVNPLSSVDDIEGDIHIKLATGAPGSRRGEKFFQRAIAEYEERENVG